jgi:hypothetical protein
MVLRSVLCREKILTTVVCSCIAVLFAAVVCAAREESRHPQASEKPDPVRCLVGVYLTSLSDFNFSTQTFNAEMWLWTHTSPGQDRKPLQTIEFTNAVSTSSELNSTTDKGGVRWAQCKVFGTFRHHWDLRNFPFDRHTLEIRFEEAIDDTSAMVYEPDMQNSSHRKNMQPDDWKIIKFELTNNPVTHSSTFGDPALKSGSSTEYAGVNVDITVERTEVASYFKLTAVAYVAFILMLIACLMHMENHDRGLGSLGTRITLLGGALFACVINMRSVSSILGSEDGITLVDKVHITVLIYIVFSAILAVFNRIMLTRGWTERKLRHIDWWAAGVSIITFVAINGLLLSNAASTR